jgi:hypothetical protein
LPAEHAALSPRETLLPNHPQQKHADVDGEHREHATRPEEMAVEEGDARGQQQHGTRHHAASLYDIHALCPYCLVVWAVTIAVFWYTTLDTLHAFDRTRPTADALTRVHTVVPVAWYAVIAILVLTAFWDYWRTLL